MLYIVPSQFTEEEITGIQKIVDDLLAANSATIIRQDNLGKIKLAYPIKKIQYGTYINVYFDAEASVIKELDRKLKLTDEVLRHMIIDRPIGAMEKKVELTSFVAPLNEEGQRAKEGEEGGSEDRPRTPRPAHASAPAPAPAPQPAVEAIAPPAPSATSGEESKMSIEELDQKLDKILEGDIAENI